MIRRLTRIPVRSKSGHFTTFGLNQCAEMLVSHVTSAVLLTMASCRIWKMVNLLSWPPLAFIALRKGWQPFKSPRALCRQSAAQEAGDIGLHGSI